MKNNITDYLKELNLEELKIAKEALINIYSTKVNNNKQQINEIISNFNDFFYKQAVIASLSYISLTDNPSSLFLLLGACFTIPTSVQAIGLFDNLSNMRFASKELKNIAKIDLNKLKEYEFNNNYYYYYNFIQEFNDIKEKKKSL